jgi:hypothetical protein
MNELIKKADQFVMSAKMHQKGLLSGIMLRRKEIAVEKEYNRLVYGDNRKDYGYALYSYDQTDPIPLQCAIMMRNQVIPELIKQQMSREEILDVITNKKLDGLTPYQKRQVNLVAFGEEFMDSDDKGDIKTYRQ